MARPAAFRRVVDLAARSTRSPQRFLTSELYQLAAPCPAVLAPAVATCVHGRTGHFRRFSASSGWDGQRNNTGGTGWWRGPAAATIIGGGIAVAAAHHAMTVVVCEADDKDEVNTRRFVHSLPLNRTS